MLRPRVRKAHFIKCKWPFSPDKCTPLLVAANNDHTEVCELFIENGKSQLSRRLGFACTVDLLLSEAAKRWTPNIIRGSHLFRQQLKKATYGPSFWLLSPLEAPRWVRDHGDGLKSIRESWGDHLGSISGSWTHLGAS